MSCDLLPMFSHALQGMAVDEDERILIAVSGGPDSMALLHLFLRWDPTRIGVFHLNHRFRESAEREAQFVADYAQKVGIPVEIVSYDVTGYLKISGESKQQGARTIRYRLLEDYANQGGYSRIALAHHGDDQAETVLMRLLRGSGLHGLAGIPPQRGRLIRPLLAFYKEELLRYCKEFHVPFVEDESNFQPVYLRNRVRQELLPFLAAEYNPEIVSQLVRVADMAREDELELQERAEDLCTQHSFKRKGQLLFPREIFCSLSVSMQRRVLRSLLRLYQGHLLQIGFEHIEAWRLELLENTTFRLSLPQVSVAATKGHLFVGDFTAQSWEASILSVPGQIRNSQFTITAELWRRSDAPPLPMGSEDFDLDALVLPLKIRPRQAGDRMEIFGLSGSKKVKDLLIDAQIPLAERNFVPMICDQRQILWIPMVRRGSAAPLHDQTKRVLRLSFKSNDS